MGCSWGLGVWGACDTAGLGRALGPPVLSMSPGDPTSLDTGRASCTIPGLTVGLPPEGPGLSASPPGCCSPGCFRTAGLASGAVTGPPEARSLHVSRSETVPRALCPQAVTLRGTSVIGPGVRTGARA